MTIDSDGDDSQTAIAQLVRWQTLSKLLSFSTVPILYGASDGDYGDGASNERIGDDDEEEDGS